MAAITGFGAGARLQPHSRGLIVLLGALTGLTALSIDMSLPALPALGAAFHTTAEQTALTLSMFLAGYSVSQLFYGPFADRYGRRSPLIVGLILFLIGGIGCAASGTIGQLIGWRLVQGLGACAGPIVARALVRDLYRRERAVQVLSYMTLVMSVAPLVAPIVGGYLLFLDWRAIFVALAAIAAVVLVAVWLALPEGVPLERRQPVRAATLACNLLDFFRRRACIAYTLIVSFAFCGLFAYISGSPFVLIEVFGVPSDRYGYLFGLNAVGLICGALANARLVRTMPPAAVLRIGSALMLAGGAVMLVCALARIGGIAGVVGPMLLYVAGMGMVTPNAIALAMEPLPHMAGFASSIIGCLQTASGGLAGYLIGLLYNRTAVPMAIAVAASAALVAAVQLGLLGRRGAAADV